jgi:hypothetical protein
MRRVEALPNGALPSRHRGDVRLHRGVAVRLCDLRVAAREEDDRLAFSQLDRLTSPAPGLAFAPAFGFLD